jgi:CRISPR-associated protein Cas1
VAWRGLHLTKPAKLSLADGQIVVDQEDGKVTLPLEDVAWVVLDATHTTLTSTLLSACMSAGVAVIVTDGRHTPSGVVLPFHRHFRQGEIAQCQVAAKAPLRKRLWRRIVRAKILNQANALGAVGRGGRTTLRAMVRHVGSGDPGNVEARAARYYWGQLWPEFRREDEGDRRNKLLNYGYAVVRAGVARSLVAAGLLPALGLKHASASNAFNLADDLVEPFRPFVDLAAWRLAGEGRPSRDELTVEDRRAMAAILLADAVMADESVTLLVAAERSAESLARAIESGSKDVLLLPSLPVGSTP